jgi:hypothetical protein
MQPTTVLFLAANPVAVPALQLAEECRAIEDKIRAAKFRDQIRLRSRWAARPDDLLQALNEDSPSVLHFSGHGAGDQGLYFQSEDGNAERVGAEGLAQVMQAAGASVVLVVLNACYSEVQAQVLVAHVPCVIGMSSAIGDKAAIVYAASLYRALAFGRSVANAHAQGLAALALHSTTREQTRDIEGAEAAGPAPIPILLHRPDVDAASVYIVQASGNTPGSVDEAFSGNPTTRPRHREQGRYKLLAVMLLCSTIFAAVWLLNDRGCAEHAMEPDAAAAGVDAAGVDALAGIDVAVGVDATAGLDAAAGVDATAGMDGAIGVDAAVRKPAPIDPRRARGPCTRTPGAILHEASASCPRIKSTEPEAIAIAREAKEKGYTCTEFYRCR